MFIHIPALPRVFEPWLWSIQRVIGSYIRSWERPGDLPRVIEILCLFESGAQRNERKETNISNCLILLFI
jgi:hypothetical protein